ncbi:MAG: NAD-dependent malic enzyme [Gammaproteobacteria bacterium]|nr:NAD-dependent malic enzyme [Gammaproteobacteria bacterium]
MLNFKYSTDPKSGQTIIMTSLSGKPLLTTPQLNKGTAFSEKERLLFHLQGKLPIRVETLEEQVARAYRQFQNYKDPLTQNIFLNSLLDNNQNLFYQLVSEHLMEFLPIIYTPIVGTAVKQFSTEYRSPRGLYISYPERAHIRTILKNRSNPEIDLIVVTDGEGVLGIGDQGIGGMDIPIAKLMVYTLCGGINPNKTLPILLDVGTNNQSLLDDPLYLGWRHPRVTGQEYDNFIDDFVQTVKELFPRVFLHWEDFGRDNARKHLERYQNQLCTFNDDMQGTGVVTLAAILGGVHALGQSLKDQRIVVFGAGTAGTGIADQIKEGLLKEGLSSKEAHQRFWLLDRPGLLLDTTPGLTDFQKPYARPQAEVAHWQLAQANHISLLDVIKNVKPTILIGSSAVAHAFNQEIIQALCAQVNRPLVLPLSNPTERCEASPEEILRWSEGKALIATGGPFAPVKFNQEWREIAQCNNALVFPGLGLGVITVQAKRLSNQCLWVACQALASCAPILKDPNAPLLPSLHKAREVAVKIAHAVAQQILDEGQAEIIPNDLSAAIDKALWTPHYFEYTPFTR